MLPAETFRVMTEIWANDSDIMKLILGEKGVEVTKNLITTVVEENMTAGPHLVSILLRRCKTLVEYEEVLKAVQAASAEGDDFMAKLLVERSAIVNSLGFNGNAQDDF